MAEECAHEDPPRNIRARGKGYKRYFWSSSRGEAIELARQEAVSEAWSGFMAQIRPASVTCTPPCKPFVTISDYTEVVDVDWEVTYLPWPFNYYYAKANVTISATIVTGCR